MRSLSLRTRSSRTILAACLVVVLAIAFLVSKAPAETSPADEAAIRAVITGQIEAFRADDETRAYGYAAPGLKQLFPSPERFMRMIRLGYAPVYRPRQVTFGALRESPHGPVKEVFLTDEAGNSWTALYTLERQEDGSWLISGCWLVRSGTSV